MLLAQLSDPHICRPGGLSNGRVDTNACFARAVEHLARLRPRPAALLLTGDLADVGAPEEYAHLARLLAPLTDAGLPVHAIPGNHDDPALLAEAFPGWERAPFALPLGPLRLIGLDSRIAGETAGALTPDTLVWLGDTLAAGPDTPALLMMHHPPIHTGLPMDKHRLRNPEALAALLAGHPQVLGILCGHVHRMVVGSLGRVPVTVCPSTAHQLTLDLSANPDDIRPSTFGYEPPGFLLHQWFAGQGLVSHLVPVGAFPGPFPFGG